MFYVKVKFTTCLVLRLSLTLSLHACSDEGERVGRQLSAGAGHRAAAHQHHDARVGRALRVPLQPGILQRLREEDSMRKSLNEGIILNTHTHTHLVDGKVYACIRDDAQHVGQVSFIKRQNALLLQDLLGTVCHARILPCFTKSKTSLQHLQNNKDRKEQSEKINVESTQKQYRSIQ